MAEDHQIAFLTPGAEIEARIEGLRRVLVEQELDAALIVQKTDLFYFGATSQQGWLYLPRVGDPLLLVFKSVERARAESPLAQVHPLSSVKQIPAVVADFGYPAPHSLGMELDVLPTNLYFQYQDIFSGVAISDISLFIRLLRAVKSDYECDLIGAAATLADQVAARVPQLLEEGKTEVSLAGELEGYARGLGHQGIVRMRLWNNELFYGHLMFGDAAAVPSYLASPTGGRGVSGAIGQGAGFRELRRNEPVLVDYVFARNGYLADHARIFCLGRLPDDLCRAHDAMLNLQETAARAAKPGVGSGEIYDLMLSRAEAAGYADYFMGAGERRIRFTGHGVGLELDEFPFIAKGQKLVLRENMVIAMEPKVIIPGTGVVGIENTFKVTTDGLIPFTTFENGIVSV
jgi:Xaa-Pro dipeptidase